MNNFKGHTTIYLLNDNWFFDMTEFICYKVDRLDNGDIKSYKEAFRVRIENNIITFDKNIRIPLKILKEAKKQVTDYYKKTGVNICE